MRNRRHGFTFESPLLTLALLAALAIVAVLLTRARGRLPSSGDASDRRATPRTDAAAPTNCGMPVAHAELNPAERTNIAVYRRVSPSVVSVANNERVSGASAR